MPVFVPSGGARVTVPLPTYAPEYRVAGSWPLLLNSVRAVPKACDPVGAEDVPPPRVWATPRALTDKFVWAIVSLVASVSVPMSPVTDHGSLPLRVASVTVTP